MYCHYEAASLRLWLAVRSRGAKSENISFAHSRAYDIMV